jgi:hypothetical protein
MNTASISVQTELKTQAQKLKHFVKTKSLKITADDEIPSDYFKNALAQAKQNQKEGKGSPIFDNAGDSVLWLEKQGI